jgi:hypothetical protein
MNVTRSFAQISNRGRKIGSLRWLRKRDGRRPMGDSIRHFPARLLTPDEHALLAEWLSAAGDIASAYVSNRRGDDPAYYRRIVIVTRPDEGPSHLIHAPMGRREWVVFSRGPAYQIDIFPTLRVALNSIRPVLVEAGMEADRS